MDFKEPLIIKLDEFISRPLTLFTSIIFPIKLENFLSITLTISLTLSLSLQDAGTHTGPDAENLSCWKIILKTCC